MRSTVRIMIGVVAVLTFSYVFLLGAQEYRFREQNANAIELCGRLKDHTLVDATNIATATVGPNNVQSINGRLLVRTPGQRACFGESENGLVVRAHVYRPD